MINYDLSFMLRINPDLDIGFTLALLQEILSPEKSISYDFVYKNNHFIMGRNLNYDAVKAVEDADNWLYFKYQIEVYPMGKIDLNEQVALARYLQQSFQDRGIEATVIANFEELI